MLLAAIIVFSVAVFCLGYFEGEQRGYGRGFFDASDDA